jgi:uncharacterized protein (DUF1778 family)
MENAEKRTARLELVLTPSEREALIRAASRRRRSHASIVREALEDWHDRQGESGDAR